MTLLLTPLMFRMLFLYMSGGIYSLKLTPNDRFFFFFYDQSQMPAPNIELMLMALHIQYG